jgi:hypothetical protein
MRECKEALKLAVAERQKYISRVKVGNMEQNFPLEETKASKQIAISA